MSTPNVIFVFADQWRYQATGFGGDPNVQTPHLDALANRSLHFTNAISGCPVCCPARASLLTGQYPDRHGVFVNDVHLGTNAVSLAQAFKAGGYDTAYIGKWHVDGHGRSAYIPPERRQGFDFWQVLECTHSYNESYYYAGNDPTQRMWEGYDAIAQTRVAQEYIREHAQADPYLLVLSWGPPHNPYETAPQQYNDLYDPVQLTLHPNVPAADESIAREQLAGYYAHCTALDDLIGDLYRTLDESGQLDNTIFVFWSDHGDMLWSQGQERKQRPWEESIHVPLLIHAPQLFGQQGRRVDTLINTT
ncbi:MAG: sulfatase, partial [Caldilineaceae bacterium]|nr:sulfatase [Caldilineaceae bacterium]